MSRTISNTLSSGITLASGDSPVSITGTGRINDGAAYAVYGPSGVSSTWTVSNSGTIVESNTNGAAVQLYSSGFDAFTNQSGGVVTSDAVGVQVHGAGVITNLANATISTSHSYASAVYIGGLATIVNAGLVQANNYAAFLPAGGSVTNLSTGTITGGGGVYLKAPGTVTNAGTIIGTASSYAAVLFASNASASRLILDPGEVITGKIKSLANSSNVIELASSASAGTLSGFDGGSITNFATLQFDSGAAWTVTGTSAAGGLGSIAITGFATGDTIDVSGFVAVSETFASNTLVLTNASNAHATLNIQGTFTSGSFSLASDGAAGTDIVLGTSAAAALVYGQTIDETGVVAASETVAAGVLTLFNAGSTAVGTIAVGTSLGSGDFTLQPDGSGGTDVIVSTVFGTYTSGIVLLTNPTTIASTASITGSVAGGIGVIGSSGTAWTLVNQGLISETGTSSQGVSFASAGTVTNAAGGVVTGNSTGIALKAGGSVTNQSGGTISGIQGLYALTGSATVVNAGSISGNLTLGSGIVLNAGGSVTNVAGGTISGSYGIKASSVAATVVNAGSIGDGSSLPTGAGIALKHGGLIVNEAGGEIIAGLQAVYIGGAAGTMVNAGTIGGGPSTGNGIIFTTGGAVTNQSGGVITGKYAIRATSGAVTVVNTGSLGGNLTAGGGVNLAAGGSVTNLSGGVITGFDGILTAGGGTVVNAGSIGGTNAVLFGSGAPNRLVVDPGAVFSGAVNGGNTIGAASVSTLELASSSSAGTLSGLGSQFVDFAQVTIDSGASWTLSGTNSLVAGATLTNASTLIGTGTLFNAGTIVGGALQLNGGALTNKAGGLITGATVYGVSGGGTDGVVNLGTISGNSEGYGIYLGAAGNVTNAAGALISGGSGIKLRGADATLVNQGQIIATGSNASYAAYLRNGGLVVNGQPTGSTTSTASIQGYYGVRFQSIDTANQTGALNNYGTIIGAGAGGDGAFLSQGGTVINGASGATAALIEGGRYGVSNEVGLVSNDATIIATGTVSGDYGVAIQLGGTISNLGSTALIRGYGGVQVQVDGTVINAGTIASSQGSNGVAVDFIGGNARLVDDPGAVFVGSIYGGTGGTAVLELASGSSAGIITGLGTSVTNFTALVFDDGAQWTVAGNDAANGLGTLTITGFSSGDTIDLTGFTAVSSTFASNTLVLTDGGGAHETLSIQGGFTTTAFHIADVGGDTEVWLQDIPSIAAGGTASFSGGDAAVMLDGSLTVSDVNSPTLAGATIEISSGFTAGDMLNFTDTAGIFGSYDASTGVLTLTGVDTLADYQAALDSVTYSFTPANGDPTNGGADTSRTISWTVTDGVASSDPATSTLNGTHVAPGITASGTVAFATGGSVAVVLDPSVTASDPDSAGLLSGATITVGSGFVVGDVLNFVNTGGITGAYDSATGVLILSGTASLGTYDTALQSITFSSAVTSAGTRTISWTVNDGVDNAATGLSTVDLTRFPPTITGSAAGQTTTDEAALDPFSGVSIGDPNGGQSETVTITLSDPADGTLSNLGGGAFNNGTYVVSGPALAVTQAVDGLVFTPTEHQVAPGSTVTTGFILQVTDSNGVTATDSTTTAIATAVNDPPAITQATNNAGVPSTGTASAAVTPFSVLTVTDPDVGHVDTVTVTMADPADGMFSILSGGTYDVATGTYSVSGSASQVTAALNALEFTAAPPAGGAFVATTGFTVAVTGPGGTVDDDTISVTTVTQLVPGLGTSATSSTISVSPDGSSFAAPTANQTNEAIVSGPTNGGTYTVPSGYQAEYLGGTANATLVDDTAANAVLVGNSGDDTISASAAGDTLMGGDGHNIFNASGTGDIIGVTGTSTVNTSGTDDVVYADANVLTLTDSGTGDAIGLNSGLANVTLTGSGASVYANSGAVDLTDSGTGDEIGASSGTLTAMLSGSNTTIYGGSGPMSVDVANTASGAVIGTGTGNATLTVAGSNTTVYGGAGMLTANVTGTDAVIGLTGGPASITLAGQAGEIFGGSGTLAVDDMGTGDTIGAGTGSTTVTGDGSDVVVSGGGGVLHFIGGAGNGTIYAGTGTTTVTGGSGALALFGGPGGELTFIGGSGAVVYQALSGAETFDGSAATASLVLNGGIDANGHDILTAGGGNDSLCAGTGAGTFTGGGGDNQFVFYKSVIAGAAPSDVITDFSANDTIYLGGYGAEAAAAALATSSSSGGSTTLTLSDNTRITFQGVPSASTLTGHVLSF